MISDKFVALIRLRWYNRTYNMYPNKRQLIKTLTPTMLMSQHLAEKKLAQIKETINKNS